MKTRQIEERRAFANAETVRRHHFLCNGGEFTLSAIGLTPAHALKVLMEEYPNAKIEKYQEATYCPCPPLEKRQQYHEFRPFIIESRRVA